MSGSIDSGRKMRITTPLGPDALALTHLSGSEWISGLYQFELSVQSPRRKPIEFGEILGQDVRVDIELPSPTWDAALTNGQFPELKSRRFCGIVQQIEERNFDTHFRYYRLSVQPRLWLWTQKSDCQIFQEKSVPQILKQILDGLHVKFQLRDGYEQRPYCVQYNESMYDFARRIMVEEGIFFYFEHQYEGQDDEQRQRGERLVVTDSIVSLPKVLNVADPDSSEDTQIEFEDVDGGNRPELRISAWHQRQQIVTTKCTVRDHSFQLPGQTLEADEEVPEQVEIAGQQHHLAPLDHDLETYHYPGDYAKRFDGIGAGGASRPDAVKKIFEENAVVAKRLVEKHASQSIQVNGESNCPQLVPGHKFTLHREHVVSGPYLVNRVEHDARLNSDFRSGESEVDPKSELKEHAYENRFVCQAEVQPFQPQPGPAKPLIHGYQTATVVGPEGEEVFSDKFGRIKVQFHWDRQGKKDANSSCWIRVSQIWAGNRWGAFFWPRVGHEVVVVFENGDPDCPLIVGSVYNAQNMPPLPLPDRLHSSGIKSCTFGGNPIHNFSCLIFHDGAGQEYLQVHSETHECMTSETTKVGFSAGPRADFQGSSNFPLPFF